MKKIKAIIFDLDGVIVDAKKIHFDSLNEVLEEIDQKYRISWDEHLGRYDGLKTSDKLELLSVKKGLPKEFFPFVWKKKQELTLEKLSNIEIDIDLRNCISLLSKEYKIACCSNSVKRTVLTVLSKLGIIEFFDLILSNEDVKNSKPHPEIYWKSLSHFGILPEEALILEDSPFGLLAASRSKCHILRVKDPDEVTIENIEKKIMEIQKNTKQTDPKWQDKRMNVLIPMAGAGSRFEKAGYTFPKPLIDVERKPMIQVVVENLNVEANFIYVVQKSHREKYNLDVLLNLLTPGCQIVEVDCVTEGAACTALLAKDYINNDNPLFFANSDQFVEWNSNEFFYKMQESNPDGGIVTFKAMHPKWSFAKLDESGFVVEVAEKNPISDDATVGFYYWKRGRDFVNSAEAMIEKNVRVNGEFYVCPVFNEAISNGMKILSFQIEKMWGLGTPEDLKYFLDKTIQ